MAWSAEVLKTVGDADELDIASRRGDGSLRPYVTIWLVRMGDDLYVRSAHGPENGWFRHAVQAGAGRVRSGGVEYDVTFEPAPSADHAALDAAYHAKYDGRYPAEYIAPVVGPEVTGVTLRLVDM